MQEQVQSTTTQVAEQAPDPVVGVPVERTLAYPIRHDAFERNGVLFVRDPEAKVRGSEFAVFCEDLPSPHYQFKSAGLYVEIVEYPPITPRYSRGPLRVEARAERPDRTRTEVIHAESFGAGEDDRAIDWARRKIVELRRWLAGEEVS